jgi:hypothetical protein
MNEGDRNRIDVRMSRIGQSVAGFLAGSPPRHFRAAIVGHHVKDKPASAPHPASIAYGRPNGLVYTASPDICFSNSYDY